MLGAKRSLLKSLSDSRAITRLTNTQLIQQARAYNFNNMNNNTGNNNNNNNTTFNPNQIQYNRIPQGTKEDPLYIATYDITPTTQAPEPPKQNKIMTTMFIFGAAAAAAYIFSDQIKALFGFDKKKNFLSMLSEEVVPIQHTNKKFSDVIGCDEAKEELKEIVEYLKDREKFTRLGGKLPKGVLLVGPPGTGKTLLAKAIAGEADVPFFYNSGSEFEEMFVGVGARRIKNLFEAARKSAPCIIFIDEIDAVGAKRNPKDQSYMRMTLNQLLSEMDGFNHRDGVIVIAATNFPESLDKALIRPGRFDRNVHVGTPDVKGRTQIIDFYLKNIAKSKDVNPSVIARGTPGFCGADLENLVNIAAVRAAMLNRPHVSMVDLEYAKDRVMMGAERKSHVMTEEARKLTAYHEGGHALVALYTAHAYPIHKATIVPRGQALGMVMQLPEKDLDNYTAAQLYAMLDVCMGGRVAEEIVFGKDQVTTGAGSDFKQATNIATQMVTKYGMSDALGPLVYEQSVHQHGQMYSSETRRNIEIEVRTLVENAYTRAKNLLNEHRSELELLSTTLLEKETLSGAEIKQLLAEHSSRSVPNKASTSSPTIYDKNTPVMPVMPVAMDDGSSVEH